MSVTVAELLTLVRGEGSNELRSRFLAESSDRNSDVSRTLLAASAWAGTYLNDRSPSPPASTPLPQPVVKVLRNAAMWEGVGQGRMEPTAKDLLSYLQGAATPEMEAIVKAALSDPESILSRMLRRASQEST